MRTQNTIFKILAFAAVLIISAASFAHAQYPGFGDPGSRQSGNATDGLVPVEMAVDGGTVPVGATSQVVVRFRNEGGQPVEMGVIRLYPSSNVSSSVSMNECNIEPLPPGAECAIALSIKGLQAGQWRTEMLMVHSGRTRLVTATLSGNVESSGDGADQLTNDIETIPQELDFETLNASQTLVEPVVLRNVTSNPINITRMYVDTSTQAGYTLKSECKSLEAGQACIAIVSWSPKLEGRSSGVLVIEHSGPAGLTSVPLKGEYAPDDVDQAEVFPKAVPGKGLLVSSQEEIEFGTNVQTASTITVSLVNVGDADINLSNIKISGSDNGLSFKEDGCTTGTLLEPVEACALTLTWSPTRIGQLFDDIQINHDGARGVLVLPIRGESTATVSQDQRAIVYGSGSLDDVADDDRPSRSETARNNRESVYGSSDFSFEGVANPQTALDGYKITSFAPTRAIINGPGGSRIIFDDEDVLLGGIPWYVTIQRNGIEFMHKGQRVLLLFDRSLSSINRVSASSRGIGSAVGSSNSDSIDSE